MKKDNLRIPDYLAHILQAIKRIGTYTDDMEVIWNTIQRDIPELEQQAKHVLQQLADQSRVQFKP